MFLNHKEDIINTVQMNSLNLWSSVVSWRPWLIWLSPLWLNMLPTHAGLQLAETDQCTLYESPLSLSFFLDVCKLCLICCMTFQQFSYYIFKNENHSQCKVNEKNRIRDMLQCDTRDSKQWRFLSVHVRFCLDTSRCCSLTVFCRRMTVFAERQFNLHICFVFCCC